MMIPSAWSRINGSSPPPSVRCVHILFQNVLPHVGVTNDFRPSGMREEKGKGSGEARSRVLQASPKTMPFGSSLGSV